MSVDLHLHTTASDGTFTPRRLVKRAVRRGVRVISLTDHDTTSGLDEACREALNWSIDIIAGIEINTEFHGGEAHILGYFIDPGHPDLETALQQVRKFRRHRMRAMRDLLAGHGIEVTDEDVARYGTGESIGRPHLAMAMVRKGHAVHVADAFERWLGRDRPAYVPRTSMGAAEAIRLVRQVGGVPVLAHPGYLGDDEVEELVAEGLQGIEALHPHHTPDRVAHFIDLARARGLGVTGGSDFHGPQVKRNVDIGEVRFGLSDLRAFCEQVGREVPRLARCAGPTGMSRARPGGR